MLIVNKEHIFLFCSVENDSHDCLSRSDWAVGLDMDLINSDGVVLFDESIEHVLSELLSLNNYLLLFRMLLWIKSRQSVDSIGLLRDSGGD